MKTILAAITAVLLKMTIVSSPADTLTLTAIDSDSISPSGSNIADNRLRAYNTGGAILDGYMKFDLSTIPDSATIDSLTLTTYHEAGFGNPFGTPTVTLYRSSTDTWSRSNSSDPYPGLNEALTAAQTGFPSADLAPVTWNINVAAFNYSTDLTDDLLTLALHNSDSDSYVYFYGSDSSPAPPQLQITFTVPEPNGAPDSGTTLGLLGIGLMGILAVRRKLGLA